MSIPQTNLSGDLLINFASHPGESLHRRLTRELRTTIRADRLPIGAAMPPSRQLADDLGCSRWAVTEAYGQLVAEGYLIAQSGSATRVRWTGDATAPATPQRPAPPVVLRIDLAPSTADLRNFPRRQWGQALAAAATSAPTSDLGYPDTAGHPHLRFTLAEYLSRSRGASLHGADLQVTTSAADGVARMCRVLAAAGVSRIAVENPGWRRVHPLIRVSGLQIVPIPVDEQGLDVSVLARQNNIGAVMMTPAHQLPSGVVLSPHRRAALLAWAAQVDAVILEDDYDAEFRYDRLPVSTLQGMQPARVVLIGSLSKTLSPAMGIGWLLAPARWVNALNDMDTTGPTPPTLDQLAYAALLSTGGYNRHLRAARRRLRNRRDAMVNAIRRALPHTRLSGIPAGLHVVAHLPDGIAAASVTNHAAQLGLRLKPLASYYDDPPSEALSGLVLGYGNLADTSVEEAVNLLAQAVNSARCD